MNTRRIRCKDKKNKSPYHKKQKTEFDYSSMYQRFRHLYHHRWNTKPVTSGQSPAG